MSILNFEYSYSQNQEIPKIVKVNFNVRKNVYYIIIDTARNGAKILTIKSKKQLLKKYNELCLEYNLCTLLNNN